MKKLPLVAALSLALATGCGPSLGIVRMRPAPLNLSPARDLSVEVQARQMGMGEALATSLGGGGLAAPVQAVDLSLRSVLGRDGSFFRVVPPGSAQCRLGVTVTDWSQQERAAQANTSQGAASAGQPPGQQGQHGASAVQRVIDGRLDVLLAATCAHRGQAVISHEFRTSRQAEVAAGANPFPVQERLLREQAEDVAVQISRQISPVQYTDAVRIDDTEKALAATVKLMQDGQLISARAQLEAYLADHPGAAAAAYNLGVLDEADGNLQAAKGRYAQAQSLKAVDLYAEGLARVARVEAERTALAGQ